MKLLYFDVYYAIKEHDAVLEKSGGLPGIYDVGRLESILTHIQNDDYYPTFEEKLTHLVFQINKGHCFFDGNKRTSIALGAFFLDVNGLGSFAGQFIVEMENIAVHVADNRIDKELLGEIIWSLVNEDEYSETLKLKLIDALGG